MPPLRADDQDWPLGQGSAWRPQQGGSGAPPPVSGRTVLTLPNSLTERPLAWTNVCLWRSQQGPHPLVLLVTARRTDVVPNLDHTFGDEVSLSTQLSGKPIGAARIDDAEVRGDQRGAGVLRVTYGIGNALRVLEVDIRPGSYQLPPCDYASVDAYAYLWGPYSIEVGASIVPGVTDTPARFTSTLTAFVPDDELVTEPVPYGARWVTMFGGCPSALGEAGQPILALAQRSTGLLILHDYETPAFLHPPGQAAELPSREPILVMLRQGGFAVRDPGDTHGGTVVIKFYLET
jgi:hypothetical protein